MENLTELEERRGGMIQLPESAAKKKLKKSWAAGGTGAAIIFCKVMDRKRRV